VSPDPGGNVLTDHVMQDLMGERGGRVTLYIQKEENDIIPVKRA